MKIFTTMIAIILFLTTTLALADNNTTTTSKPKIPPPPPPPIDAEVFSQEVPASQQQGGQTKTEDITDVYSIPEHIWKDLLSRRDTITPYLQDYKHITISPYERRTLNKTNFIAYTPTLPLLIKLPWQIKTVMYADLQTKQSMKTVFDKNLLLVFPPSPNIMLWSFIVISQDDEAYYFICEKNKTIDNATNRKVVPYITFTMPSYITDKDILSAFYRQNKRCPFHGEYFEINQTSYRFVIKEQSMLSNDTVKFCNRIYKIETLTTGK